MLDTGPFARKRRRRKETTENIFMETPEILRNQSTNQQTQVTYLCSAYVHVFLCQLIQQWLFYTIYFNNRYVYSNDVITEIYFTVFPKHTADYYAQLTKSSYPFRFVVRHIMRNLLLSLGLGNRIPCHYIIIRKLSTIQSFKTAVKAYLLSE